MFLTYIASKRKFKVICDDNIKTQGFNLFFSKNDLLFARHSVSSRQSTIMRSNTDFKIYKRVLMDKYFARWDFAVITLNKCN